MYTSFIFGLIYVFISAVLVFMDNYTIYVFISAVLVFMDNYTLYCNQFICWYYRKVILFKDSRHNWKD